VNLLRPTVLPDTSGTLKTRDWKRRDWKTRDYVARGGKRGTRKRRTLKVWKALQFSKAKAMEQRSREFTAAWTGRRRFG